MSQRQVTVLLGFGQLLAWGSSFYLLAILAEPMAAGLALPRVWVYLCFSASLVMAAVLGPLGGQLIDRHGGRPVLMAGNVVFALALLLMSQAQGGASLMLGWLLLGVAMPLGLYDAGFATAVRLFGAQARRSIVGITLIAGFASSVSWPLTHWLEQRWDWRVACQVWAVLHLTAGLALHARLPRVEVQSAVSPQAASESAAAGTASRRDLWLLAAVFACGGFVFASLAAHLPLVVMLMRHHLRSARQLVDTATFVVAQRVTPRSPGGTHWLWAAAHTPQDPLSHWACLLLMTLVPPLKPGESAEFEAPHTQAG